MNATENLYKCPTDDSSESKRGWTPLGDLGASFDPPLIGCGFVFWAIPDDEGLVDCPECGLWFKPRPQDIQP